MKKCLKIITIIFLIMIGASLFYFIPYSKAKNLPKLPKTVTKTQEKEGLFYDGKGKDTLLIIYPGAKVDTKAYEPIAAMLAEDGIDCYIVDMPLHFAFFNSKGADKVMKKHAYKNYYIAGHSLGGAMAANYVSKDQNWKKFKGIIFLAAYSANDLHNTDLKALSIYGSNDGVLNLSKVRSGRKYFKKENYTEKIITGGNHAQFGSYGKQSGDNKAEISARKQWGDTTKMMEKLVQFQED